MDARVLADHRLVAPGRRGSRGGHRRRTPGRHPARRALSRRPAAARDRRGVGGCDRAHRTASAVGRLTRRAGREYVRATMPGAPDDALGADRAAIRELVERWAVARDALDWETFHRLARRRPDDGDVVARSVRG